MKRFLCLFFAGILLLQASSQAESYLFTDLPAKFSEAQGNEVPPHIQRLMLRAQNGDAESQYLLGGFYIWGKVFPGNYLENVKQGVEWYQKSAEQGHAGAQKRLGDAYNLGLGVKKDEKEAQKWWGMAAAQYKQHAEEGDAQAQYELGEMYSEGHGVPLNLTETLRWYRKAAEQGHTDAKFKIGMIEEQRPHASNQKKAAEQGNTQAQAMLAYWYEVGTLFYPKNITESVRWYRQAAEHGNIQAQMHLAEIYSLGKNVPKNRAESLRWYRKAAEQGSVLAKTCLGSIYFQGDGVPQDYAQAYLWWNLAAAQDHGFAKGRDEIARNMTRKQIAEVQRLAQEWLKMHPKGLTKRKEDNGIYHLEAEN